MTAPTGYVRPRGNRLEAVIQLGGRRIQKATGYAVGQEAEAQKFLDDLLAELAGADAPGAPAAAPGDITLREWGERWLAERKARKVISVGNEEGQLRYHVFPILGGYPLHALTKPQMLAWVRSLPSRKRVDTGEPLSSRTVHHIAGTVRRLLAEAVDMDLLAVSPCTWKAKRDLPPKLDVDPEKRSTGGFEGWEVYELVTSEKVPEDRRVQWAIEFLTGMRPGEVAARRWRDVTLDLEGTLGRIDAATAWNSRVHREKSTKTNIRKAIPLHPLLASILRAWRDEGWKRYVGRAPEPDDLVVPSERGLMRNSSQSNKRFSADVARVGLRAGRTHYETRSSFRSLALAGGAVRGDLDLITHPSPRQASDLYTRLAVVWPALCRAVLAVQVGPRACSPSPVVGVAGAPRDIALQSPADMEKAPEPGAFSSTPFVGAAGFEPATFPV